MGKTVPQTRQSKTPLRSAVVRADMNDLIVFTRVVQAGSFTLAARLLGMPKSTVSRRVTELEDRLKARLLQRTTRKLGLTDAGRIYFAYSERIAADVEDAERALGQLQDSPRGLLRVTAPHSFSLLGPVLSEFLAAHSEVRAEIMCTDRPVDLVAEGFDLAIRIGHLEDSTLVTRSLGSMRRVLVASPSYCRRRGVPRLPADLAEHETIAFAAGSARAEWSLRGVDETVDIRIAPRATINDFRILVDAVRAGLGIAWMPEFGIATDVKEGRLRRVLPDWHSEAIPLQVVYPTARHLSPKVAAFVELLARRLTLGPPRAGSRNSTKL